MSYRIGLSTTTYDLDGAIVLKPLGGSALDSFSRRVNRVATLDGGVVVNDGGYAAGDRTLTVRWWVRNAAQYAAVRRLVTDYSALVVCTKDGAYSAVASSIEQSGREGRLELLVTDELHQ